MILILILLILIYCQTDKLKDPELIDLTALMRTSIGSSVYKEQGTKLQYLRFLESIKSGYNTIFHHDFDKDEVKGIQGGHG